MQANPDFAGEISIIEDNADARATLTDALMLAGYEVICFSEGNGLLARARIRTPLCVFLDVGERDKRRFGLLDQIGEESWRAPVFASSVDASIPLAVDAILRGAYDFIAKPFDGGDIAARVRTALMATRCARVELPAKLRNDAQLTAREWDVMEGIALGETSKEIARRLGLSSRTVESYRADALSKCGVRSTTELVRRMFDRTNGD